MYKEEVLEIISDFEKENITLADASLAMVSELISSLEELTGAVEKLGVNNADTKMGGMEIIAKEIKEGFESVTNEIKMGFEDIDEKLSRIDLSIDNK